MSPDRGIHVDGAQVKTVQDGALGAGSSRHDAAAAGPSGEDVRVEGAPREETTAETAVRAAARVDPTASSVLRTLRDRTGLDTWVLVHRVDGNWRILHGLRGNDELRARGLDPDGHCFPALLERSGALDRLALVPRVRDVPGLAEVVPPWVASYAGLPLRPRSGELVGVLLGADAQEHDDLPAHQPFLTLVGELLAAILVAELRAAAADLRAEAATVQSLRDPLTGLGNRRLWDRLLVSEEERCRRHETPATVVVIDVDDLKVVNDAHGHAAGDDLLRRAARALRDLTRAPDVVTRTGGDEFAMVAVDCSEAEAGGVVDRLRAAFVARGVDASVGYAVRDAPGGLAGAWSRADAAMYREKFGRRAAP